MTIGSDGSEQIQGLSSWQIRCAKKFMSGSIMTKQFISKIDEMIYDPIVGLPN
jgi:hypothetical protein